MKVKIIKTFLSLWSLSGAIAESNILNASSNEVSLHHSPLFYVSGLIKDWNSKNLGSGDILVLNFGDQNYMSENIANILPKENLVIIVNGSQCNKFGSRKAAFVVITIDRNFNDVS